MDNNNLKDKPGEQPDRFEQYLNNLIENAPEQDKYAITGIKAVGEDRIGGYLVPFGNTIKKDLHDEYFSKNTDLILDFLPVPVWPILFHHGLDDEVGVKTLGKIDKLEKRANGWWAEGIIDKANKYRKQILKLIKLGILHWSSGTLPQMVQRSKAGEILRWPLVEGSLTPTPAEPRFTTVAMVKSAYKSAGIELPEGLLEEEDEGKEVLTTTVERTAGGDVHLTLNLNSPLTTINEGTADNTDHNGRKAGLKEQSITVTLWRMLSAAEENVEDVLKSELSGITYGKDTGLQNVASGWYQYNPSTDGKSDGILYMAEATVTGLADGRYEISDWQITPVSDGRFTQTTQDATVPAEKGKEEGTTTEETEPAKTEPVDNDGKVVDNTEDTEADPNGDADNDEPNEDTKTIGRDFSMNDHIFQMVGNFAIVRDVTLNTEQTQDITDKIIAHVKALIGEEDITDAYLKLALSNADFKRQINDWISEYAPEVENDEEAGTGEDAKADADAEEGKTVKLPQTQEELESIVNRIVNQNNKNKLAEENPKTAAGQAHSDGVATHIVNMFKKGRYEKLEDITDVAWVLKTKLELARVMNRPHTVDADLIDVLHDRMKSMDTSLEEFLIDPDTPYEVPSSIKAMEAWGNVHSPGMKADVILAAGATGQGLEWVQEIWQGGLWNEARADNNMFNMFTRINMPSNPYHIRLQNSPGVVFAVPETTDDMFVTTLGVLPRERITTDKILMYAHGMGNQVILSRRAIEDSNIPLIMEARNTQRKMMADGMDWTLLNADITRYPATLPAAGANHNLGLVYADGHDDAKYTTATQSGSLKVTVDAPLVTRNAHPTTADALLKGLTHHRGNMGFNGLVRIAFDQSWTHAPHASNATDLSLAVARAEQEKLHHLFYNDRANLVWVTTPQVEFNWKFLPQYETARAHSATSDNAMLFGNLKKDIDGIPLVVVEQFGNAAIDGKISAPTFSGTPEKAVAPTGTDANTRGRALLIYKPHYLVGFRRNIETDMRASIFSDTVQMGIVQRYGFIGRDVKRRTLSYLYNLRAGHAPDNL